VTRITKRGKDYLSFLLTIRNVGNTPLTGTFVVRFYRSTDQTWDGGDTLLLTRTVRVTRLAPSRTTSLIGAATVPSPSHGRFLLGVIDATNTIVESNETNNLATAVIP